ncbi:hypothetical protein H5410_021228 [Solanum commersonii]|uniref:Uncharacterized protein n=1 Tax=Solanum commersonii TaxID=4109 RepID=A0A9J5ZAD8_SOLCO|nr:hypothetical protein H5410_021228 [Solanum commersonii]
MIPTPGHRKESLCSITKGKQKLWEEISPPQPSRKLSPSGSGTKSWAEEIEEEQMQRPKEKSMWDTFDIAKLSNDGFKLDYVAPEK